MEPINYKCVRHQNPNELFCMECNSYLCAECVTDHGTETHKPKYEYILQHARKSTMPKIDKLIALAEEQGKYAETESKELAGALKEMVPELKEATQAHLQAAECLRTLLQQLDGFSKQTAKGSYLENFRTGLKNDKTKLETAINGRQTKETLKIAQRIEEEVNVASSKVSAASLIKNLQTAFEQMEKMDPLKATIEAVGQVAAKGRLFKMAGYTVGWKCDRQFVSSKMTLSADGLTFGNASSNGYPAIIGDVPFESGLYAYEVVPTGLDCAGKEGFGIVERDKYIAAHATDPTTPAVYDHMIGYFYRGEAKNMTVERVCDMKMGSKYFVRVNIPELSIKITGPGVSLRAELKAGIVYAPCFSCGCSGNKLTIRLLSDYDEPDST